MEAGIDTGKVKVRLYRCKEASAVGAGDNMKMVQEEGKAIVGPAYVLVASPARYYAAKKKKKLVKIGEDVL